MNAPVRLFRLVVGVAAATLLSIALAGSVGAAQIPMIALLNTGQEVPPIDDLNGQGIAFLTFDTQTRDLCYAITYSDLSGTAIAAHFHGPAEPGENAPVVIPIAPESSPSNGCVGPLDGKQASELRSGLWYVNFHTAANPNGEIRGQVLETGGAVLGRGAGRLPIIE